MCSYNCNTRNTKPGGAVFRLMPKCLHFRSRSTGLLLREPGGCLLSFDKAPSGTKRISILLRNRKRGGIVITDYLTTHAQEYA